MTNFITADTIAYQFGWPLEVTYAAAERGCLDHHYDDDGWLFVTQASADRLHRFSLRYQDVVRDEGWRELWAMYLSMVEAGNGLG